ncbi:MAG: hypothetical protein U5J62_01645 [Desulfurivibrio sp.]|nr:hypothetical protein [Desulfurivibrio sp.]
MPKFAANLATAVNDTLTAHNSDADNLPPEDHPSKRRWGAAITAARKTP